MTEDDRYPVEDWRYEVANGDTWLGYAHWLRNKYEADNITECEAAGCTFMSNGRHRWTNHSDKCPRRKKK